MKTTKVKSGATMSGLLMWKDLAAALGVVDERQLLLMAIEGKITLGTIATKEWRIELGNYAIGENGEYMPDKPTGEDEIAGFKILPNAYFRELIHKESVTVGELWRHDGTYGRVTGVLSLSGELGPPPTIQRQDLCGRITPPNQYDEPPKGEEHKYQRLFTIAVALYHRTMAQHDKDYWNSKNTENVNKLALDLSQFIDANYLDGKGLSKNVIADAIKVCLVALSKESAQGKKEAYVKGIAAKPADTSNP